MSGYLFLHNSTSRYLSFDGTFYRMPNATLVVDSLDAGSGEIKTTGSLKAGTTILGTTTLSTTTIRNGDLAVYRSGGTTGFVFLHNGTNKYLAFDGTNYRMPNAPLIVDSLDSGSGEVKTTGSLRGGSLTVSGETSCSALTSTSTSPSDIVFARSSGGGDKFVRGGGARPPMPARCTLRSCIWRTIRARSLESPHRRSTQRERTAGSFSAC